MDVLEAARREAERYRTCLASPTDAERGALFALRRCRTSLELLSERLREDGYPNVLGVLPRADASLLTAVRQLLGRHPPRILELFWQEVGGVEVVDFADYRHVDFFEDRDIDSSTPHETTDALVVFGLDQRMLNALAGELETHHDNTLQDEDSAPFIIDLAPDHHLKDHVSGGGPYGIRLGDDDWVPELIGFEWIGAARPSLASATPDFLSYLRAAILECGGFPGLLGSPSFEPLRRRLTSSLPVF